MLWTNLLHVCSEIQTITENLNWDWSDQCLNSGTYCCVWYFEQSLKCAQFVLFFLWIDLRYNQMQCKIYCWMCVAVWHLKPAGLYNKLESKHVQNCSFRWMWLPNIGDIKVTKEQNITLTTSKTIYKHSYKIWWLWWQRTYYFNFQHV